MKSGNTFTKKDIIVALCCIGFLLANIAAIGEGGRKRAKEALCLSNLMKWGQIFQAYTADNDGYFHGRLIGVEYNKLWPYVYKPYYIDPMMRFCPTAANPRRYWGTFGTWNYGYGSFHPILSNCPMQGEREYDPFYEKRYTNGYFTGSYGMNRYIENIQGSFASDPSFWRRADVKGGDKVPVLMDCMYLYYYPSANADPPSYDGDFSYGMQWPCINRHTGYVNAVFLDFSARKVGLKEIWTLKHSRTYNTCGPWTQCGGVQPNDWPEWMRDFKDY